MSRPQSERLSAPRVFSHLGVMLVVSAILGVVVAGLAIPFAGVVGFTARNAADTMDELPKELETDSLAQKTRIVDGAGDTIATVFDENRINVSLDQISRTMVKAIVAIEDYRFYQHGALDVKGTLRALLTNQAASGVVQGGSSITQQMVKLTLLNQADTKAERRAALDDTYARKLRELRYAIAVEQRHSKDWILERYLNIAYFGDGAYGVQAAARHYFNVNARGLNLNQSAILAGLVQNPTAFDPTNSPDRTVERRDVVLDRMAQLSVVPKKKAERIRERGLRLDVQPNENGCVNSSAPFFCDYALAYLMKDPALGKNAEERKRLIYSGGLTIRTTVDLRYQAAADESVRNTVFPQDGAIGAMAMVEPGTGEVKAISQSRPMGRDKAAGETFLNYVVPKQYGGAAGFQGGSTFKVFTLAAALEQGIPLSRTYFSPAAKTFQFEAYEDCRGDPYGFGTFPIVNSTSSGTMNMYTGTRLSVNTFYMQLIAETGLCEPFALAKQMGLELDNPVGNKPGSAERVPTFTLGVPDVSPLEMAEAYATFGARGLHCASRPVTAIEDSDGNLLKEYPEQCTQVMEQSTADAVNDVLRGVIEGGFAANEALAVPAAGKTGTTSANTAVWFNGYTPTMATVAMVAGANEFGTPTTLDNVNVGGVTLVTSSGSGTAGPMWGDAMKVVDDFLPSENFVYPSTVPGAGQEFIPAPPSSFGDDDDDDDFGGSDPGDGGGADSGGLGNGRANNGNPGNNGRGNGNGP